MNTAHHMARMPRDRIILHGNAHDVLTLDALETLAHGSELTVEYPLAGSDGWATTRLGSLRFAAWLPVGVEA